MSSMCLCCFASLQEFEYWWWDLAMVSTEGFYIRKVRRPPPSYQIFFSHWLCARTSHCPNSTATVSKSPSSHNATRSESTNWWSYMPDLARDSPPSSSHRPIKPSGSTRDRIYWSVKEAYISWHACFCQLCTRLYYPGWYQDLGVVRVAPSCVGSGLIFHGLVRIRSEKFNGGIIILIGEILGAYALTASLDRFPRFAYGLDRPKPSLSLGFSHNDVGCGWDGHLWWDGNCICQPTFLLGLDGCRDTDHLRSSERVRWHGLIRCNQPKTI